MEEQDQQRKRMSCGLDYTAVPQLNEQLYSATNVGYHFIVIPFVHPRYRRELISGKCKNREEPLTRSDLVLTSQDWNRLVVGKLSPYLEIDCEVEHVRKQSEAVFLQELEFASHLSLPAILLPLHSSKCMNMARILNSKMSGGCTYQVWVQTPMVVPHRNDKELETGDSSWDWWNALRSHCDYDKKLGLALEMSHELPSDLEMDRWLGEPVKCLIINTNLFLTNQKDYPVLSRAHQDVIRKFLPLDVQYIIKGKNHHGDISQYCSYINFLGKKLYTTSAFTEYIQGYDHIYLFQNLFHITSQ